ncbi:hypothetical protein BGX28_010025 [Mortierella sp. GBA30]|nr:hypothetical protein BGX28_010025 [Mortierella sp. GBA30]
MNGIGAQESAATNANGKYSRTTAISFGDHENGWNNDSDLSQDGSYYVPSTPYAQKIAGLDPSSYQGSGDDFCTEDNFDQTSAYMNHLLSIHGFSTNLQFLRADKHSASRIVTAFYKLLQQHLKDTEYKNEMDLNWRRLSQDYETTLQNLNTTKIQMEKSECESDILGSRISALEEELRVESEKHRHTREELKSAKANLQYTKTQYAHEARKKEQEMNVLKDKVQKSIARNLGSATSSSIPGGITILNPVPRSLYGKQHTNDAEQLLKEVIEQQHAKETEIVEENEQLRRTLHTVQVELEGLMKKHSRSKSSAPNPYGLPFEMVKDRIETDIRDTLTLLSNQWDHRPALEPTISASEIIVRDQKIEDLQRDIEKMQLELEDSTLLVQGAQKMIDNLSSGNFLAGVQDFKLNVNGSEMTLQELDEAEVKIQKQREDLAKEREQFTEACLDLGKQREELRKAKQEFEESKRTFRLDKVVSFLTFSPTPDPYPTRQDHSLSSTPHVRASAANPRKRTATSLSPQSRSVRPKISATVIEVPDAGERQEREIGRYEGGPDEGKEEEEEEEEKLTRVPARSRIMNFTPSFAPSGISPYSFNSSQFPKTRPIQPSVVTASVAPPESPSVPRLGSSSTIITPTPTPFMISFTDRKQPVVAREIPSDQYEETLAPINKVSEPSTTPFTFTATLPSSSRFSSAIAKAKAGAASGFSSSFGSGAGIPATSRLATVPTSTTPAYGNSLKAAAITAAPSSRDVPSVSFNPRIPSTNPSVTTSITSNRGISSTITKETVSMKADDAGMSNVISGTAENLGLTSTPMATSRQANIAAGPGATRRPPLASTSTASSVPGPTYTRNTTARTSTLTGISKKGAAGRTNAQVSARWR